MAQSALLATAMGDYINALNSQWTALANLANLLQVEQLQELDGETVRHAVATAQCRPRNHDATLPPTIRPHDVA